MGVLLHCSVTFHIGDEDKALRPGATWVIPAHVPHSVEVGPDGASIIELFSPPRADWGGLAKLDRARPQASGSTRSSGFASSVPGLDASASESRKRRIAIIVRVTDVESARVAEAEGAKALAVAHAISGIREATTLPLLWSGGLSRPTPTPSCFAPMVLRTTTRSSSLSTSATRRSWSRPQCLDPEYFRRRRRSSTSTDDPLDAVLELLPDVP